MPTTRTAHVAVVAAVTALAALGALAPAPAAEAADGPEWTVRTAANDLGADRSAYAYTVEPGEVVRDGIVITNRGTAPLDLVLAAGAARTAPDGRLDVPVTGPGGGGVGDWVRLGAPRVTVAPGASETVPLTVRVPAGTRAGDRVGAVLTAARERATGTDVVRRIGIRMTVRVTGDLRPALAVEDERVEWSGGLAPTGRGTATVVTTLRNTGNTVLRVEHRASVAGPFGVGRWNARGADLPLLLPGERRTVRVPVPGVPGLGALDAEAAATPVVTDAAGTTSELDPVVVRAAAPAVPWVPVLLGLLVVAAGVGIAVLRGRGARPGSPRLRRPARAPREHPEPTEG